MKIVFIGPFGLQPKGTMSVRALPLAKALAARGHAVTILIPPWDDPARSGQTWEDDGVRVVNVALPRGIPLLFHILLTGRLVIRALAVQPDVIHFFKPKAYAGFAHFVFWWLRRLRGRSMRLIVDSDDWEQAWNDRLSYSAVQKKLFAWQETWGLHHADSVTVASRELERLIAHHRESNHSQIFYVPNGSNGTGSNLSPLSPQAIRQTWRLSSAPVILLYSRFLEFRLERVVTLVRLLAEKLPEARWLMVGQGLNGEDEKLRRQLAVAGLAETYVRFTGWLPAEQLASYFKVANVAAFLYDDWLINRTKCSVKLIDLLRAGVPVVADAVGQNCEYIQSYVTGVLVPAEDDVAFAEALVDLLRNPGKQRRLGEAAAYHVNREFNWHNLSQIVEKAYLEEIRF